MKRFAMLATVVVMAAAAVAPAAQANVVLTFAAPALDGSFSGSFADTGIPSGTFTDTANFTLPSGSAGATISSIMASSQQTNVNFSAVSLDGVQFAIGSTGNVEFRFLNPIPVQSGTQTLVVSGISGGDGSFAGTIAFSPASAVPEPSTWAMMILGFEA